MANFDVTKKDSGKFSITNYVCWCYQNYVILITISCKGNFHFWFKYHYLFPQNKGIFFKKKVAVNKKKQTSWKMTKIKRKLRKIKKNKQIFFVITSSEPGRRGLGSCHNSIFKSFNKKTMFLPKLSLLLKHFYLLMNK